MKPSSNSGLWGLGFLNTQSGFSYANRRERPNFSESPPTPQHPRGQSEAPATLSRLPTPYPMRRSRLLSLESTPFLPVPIHSPRRAEQEFQNSRVTCVLAQRQPRASSPNGRHDSNSTTSARNPEGALLPAPEGAEPGDAGGGGDSERRGGAPGGCVPAAPASLHFLLSRCLVRSLE